MIHLLTISVPPIADNLKVETSPVHGCPSELYIRASQAEKADEPRQGAFTFCVSPDEMEGGCSASDLRARSVGKAVGYHKPGAFTEAFRRNRASRRWTLEERVQ